MNFDIWHECLAEQPLDLMTWRAFYDWQLDQGIKEPSCRWFGYPVRGLLPLLERLHNLSTWVITLRGKNTIRLQRDDTEYYTIHETGYVRRYRLYPKLPEKPRQLEDRGQVLNKRTVHNPNRRSTRPVLLCFFGQVELLVKYLEKKAT